MSTVYIKGLKNLIEMKKVEIIIIYLEQGSHTIT